MRGATATQIFGERVRARRFELVMSHAEVAAAAGISASQVSRIERGAAVPRLDTIIGLAAALDLNPGDLVRDISADGLPPSRRAFKAADYLAARRAQAVSVGSD